MEIKEEIGKVIAIRKKAICSNCGTEMESRVAREEMRGGYWGEDWSFRMIKTYEYSCPKCGEKEESEEKYPCVYTRYVFDDDEEKS